MTSRRFRAKPDPSPARRHLAEVRRGFFRLHKALVDAERLSFERRHGPQTSGMILQAIIQDPFFAWLRPFSELLVEIDEALAGEEPITPDSARGYIERVHELIADPDEQAPPEDRYQVLRRANPDVLLAHVELSDRIEWAPDAS